MGTLLRQTIRTAALAVASLCTLQFQAAAQVQAGHHGLSLYDNFDSPYVDPARWYTGYSCTGRTTLECVRQIEDGHLHLRARAYGDRTSNVGTEYGDAEFAMVNSAVTDIAVELSVLQNQMSPCTTSPGAGTKAQTILWGNFFNDGSGTQSGDTTAFLVLERGSADPANQVQASVFLQYQGVFFGDVVLGTYNVGEPLRIELHWDKSNHQFLASVTRLRDHTTVQAATSYTSPDSTPPFFPEKAIGTRAFPENCTGVPTFVDIETRFDRVEAR